MTRGRPPVYDPDDNRVAMAVRIPDALRERLTLEAQRRRIGRNLIVEQILEEGIVEWEQE